MRRLLAFFCFFCLSLAGQAQTPQASVRVSGSVLQAADQKPLSGVTIVARPGRLATTSMANGSFSIKAKPGDTLVFYSVGFKNARYLVSTKAEQVIKIKLEQQDVKLQEVEITSRPSAEKINRAMRNMKKKPEPDPIKAPPAPEPLWEEKETTPVKVNAYNNPATFLYDKYSKEGKEKQKMEAIYQQKADSAARAKEAKYDELFLDRNKPFKEQYFYYRGR